MEIFIAQKSHVDAKIKTLSKLVPSLKGLKNNAGELVNTIHGIAESSENISNKVRALDCARVRYIISNKRI